jgi:hypothetical protein
MPSYGQIMYIFAPYVVEIDTHTTRSEWIAKENTFSQAFSCILQLLGPAQDCQTSEHTGLV